MKTWRRAGHDRICGRCGHRIAKGDPVLELKIPQATFPKLRCAGCAGEPVPADLPPLEAPVAITPTVKAPRQSSVSSVGTLAADWKVKQSGDGE